MGNKKLYWIIGILAAIIVIIIVGFLIIGFSGGASKDVDKFNIIEEDFLNNYDTFFTEYSLSNPESVNSDATLSSAVAVNNKARGLLAPVKSNLSQMQNLILEAKGKSKGDAGEWWNQVSECYEERNNEIALYDDILNNEKKYYDYYESFSKGAVALAEIATLFQQSLYYGQINDKQKDIDTLNKMKQQVLISKTNMQKAYNAINFEFLRKYQDLMDMYDEFVDLNLQAYATTDSTEYANLARRITDKLTEIVKLSGELTATAIKNEFDAWYTPNISDKIAESKRVQTSLGQCLEKSRGLYSAAFPNAAVITEFAGQSSR